jgi:hypothetical protein
LSYSPRGGHGYGNNQHGSSGGSRFSWRKQKKPKEVINVKEEPEPKVAPETIVWTPRPLEQNVQVFLSTPTTMTSNASKSVLSNDLTKQNELGYQIALLAESQKLGVEVLTPEGATLKYKIIKLVDQKPEDKPVSFGDMAFVGNLKGALKPCGYTLVVK